MAPAGMGSQKLTSRQPSTPSVATLRVTPKLTSSSGASESMTPSPAGVMGSPPVADQGGQGDSGLVDGVFQALAGQAGDPVPDGPQDPRGALALPGDAEGQ